jgi:molybdopterin synthase catalytic subunit
MSSAPPSAVPRLAITRDPLSLERLTLALAAEARDRAEGCGALCSFLGVVRGTHRGRRVTQLDYEAFEPLALKVFAGIAEEIAADWPEAQLGLHHRIGRLQIGEASVAIVVASPHRAEAFEACRYAIERVKQIAPIWKHEFLDDGEVWMEGALADPADAAAKRVARERACR